MEIAMLVIGIILLVFAVFLVVAVLMQQGKAHNLSGTIAGGAETFFGKSKGQTINKKLSIVTTVVAIIFALLVCSVTIMQDSGKSIGDYDNFWQLLNPFSNDEAVEDDDTADAADDTADAADDTADVADDTADAADDTADAADDTADAADDTADVADDTADATADTNEAAE